MDHHVAFNSNKRLRRIPVVGQCPAPSVLPSGKASTTTSTPTAPAADSVAEWVNHVAGDGQVIMDSHRVATDADVEVEQELQLSFPHGMQSAATEIFRPDSATDSQATPTSADPHRGLRTGASTLLSKHSHGETIRGESPVLPVELRSSTSKRDDADDESDSGSLSCSADILAAAVVCAASAMRQKMLVAEGACTSSCASSSGARYVTTEAALRSIQVSREPVPCSSSPQSSLSSALERWILKPLSPTVETLELRHHIIETVCSQITAALRTLGVVSPIACYVFGSVHLRTVLPDGDNDITVVILDEKALDGASNATGTPVTDGSSPTFSCLTPATSGIGAQDLLPKVKDFLVAREGSPLGIFVDSLIFAEVRVLKLGCQGLSMDVTMQQTGGTSTACLLHMVDQKLGFQHLLKRTLLLLKAWANYEARILGGQGGYLGTYAFTVMLISVANQYLRHADPDGEAQPTPLWLMRKFFAYYSAFDFSKYCVTVYGPLPLAAIAALSGGNAASVNVTINAHHHNTLSSASSDTTASEILTSAEEGSAAGPLHGLERGPLHHSVAGCWDPRSLPITEDFVSECARKFGRGKNGEIASMTPTTTPVQLPVFPKEGGIPPSPAKFREVDRSPRSQSGTSQHMVPADAGNLPPSRSQCVASHYVSLLQSSSIQTAASSFPIREMNVMDPLRPSSNLSRGVSRAHWMRIQNAMTLGLQQFESSATAVDNGGVAAEAALEYGLFPNTVEILRSLGLAPRVALGHPLDSAEFDDAPSASGGSVGSSGGQILCQCGGCSKPSIFCVEEATLSAPEFIAPRVHAGSAEHLSGPIHPRTMSNSQFFLTPRLRGHASGAPAPPFSRDRPASSNTPRSAATPVSGYRDPVLPMAYGSPGPMQSGPGPQQQQQFSGRPLRSAPFLGSSLTASAAPFTSSSAVPVPTYNAAQQAQSLYHAPATQPSSTYGSYPTPQGTVPMGNHAPLTASPPFPGGPHFPVGAVTDARSQDDMPHVSHAHHANRPWSNSRRPSSSSAPMPPEEGQMMPPVPAFPTHAMSSSPPFVRGGGHFTGGFQRGGGGTQGAAPAQAVSSAAAAKSVAAAAAQAESKGSGMTDSTASTNIATENAASVSTRQPLRPVSSSKKVSDVPTVPRPAATAPSTAVAATGEATAGSANTKPSQADVITRKGKAKVQSVVSGSPTSSTSSSALAPTSPSDATVSSNPSVDGRKQQHKNTQRAAPKGGTREREKESVNKIPLISNNDLFPSLPGV